MKLSYHLGNQKSIDYSSQFFMKKMGKSCFVDKWITLYTVMWKKKKPVLQGIIHIVTEKKRAKKKVIHKKEQNVRNLWITFFLLFFNFQHFDDRVACLILEIKTVVSFFSQ